MQRGSWLPCVASRQTRADFLLLFVWFATRGACAAAVRSRRTARTTHSRAPPPRVRFPRLPGHRFGKPGSAAPVCAAPRLLQTRAGGKSERATPSAAILRVAAGFGVTKGPGLPAERVPPGAGFAGDQVPGGAHPGAPDSFSTQPRASLPAETRGTEAPAAALVPPAGLFVCRARSPHS